jgi:endoglucanase
MKSIIILSFILLAAASNLFSKEWVRINQLGYLPSSSKNAVYVTKGENQIESFFIYDAETKTRVFEGGRVKNFGKYGAFTNAVRLDFTEFKREGNYYIEAGGAASPVFRISKKAYEGSADFLLNYMRQQRCGYNPYLKDSCHVHDGFIVDHPERTGEYIDVKGGWHDASDYLQYLTTSATATYQMMFAYKKNPKAFKDEFDENGNPGGNGIPDILDEARWGLEWMIKMNPEYGVMFNQIADDRDHGGFRLPTVDTITYGGSGLQRPVYFITGKQQGICKYKNRVTGVSSSAGKFASSFAMGGEVFNSIDPGFAKLLRAKSVEAYEFGKTDLGVAQTASCKAPYFYEEDNYVDDMELAAAQLFVTEGERKYFAEAAEWGKVEPVTPWIGADTARHYQWYPFINLGHYILASSGDSAVSELFINYMRQGLERLYKRGENNPFFIGIPFIWCSNNLVSAAITQARLYNQLTGDDKYLEMEGSLRDWLFGCNPWGTSMIVGLPEWGDTPVDPHSAFTALHKMPINGGLVDGPLYQSIFGYLIGLKIYNGDEYAEFQSKEHVYHDDYGDYSTNEPTMDGTAGLIFYLSSMENIED